MITFYLYNAKKKGCHIVMPIHTTKEPTRYMLALFFICVSPARASAPHFAVYIGALPV